MPAIGLAGAPALKFDISAEDRTAAVFAKVKNNLLSLDKAASGLVGLSGLGTGLFAGGALDAIVRIKDAFVDVFAESANLATTADRIGVTTERLQELRLAAQAAGIDTVELDSDMQMFAKNIGLALTGGGELAKVLELNNVKLRDQSGAVRPLNDLLNDYADLIRNASSEQERLALAQIAFGRGGTDMVSITRNGAAGLRDMAEESDKLGIIQDDLTRKGAALNKQYDELTTTIGNFYKITLLAVADTAPQIAHVLFESSAYLRALAFVAEQVEKFARPKSASDDYRLLDTSGTDASLRRQLSPGTQTTVLPHVQSPEEKAAAAAAKSAQERIDTTVAALTRERDMLTMSGREQAIWNAEKQAGIDRTGQYSDEVAKAAAALYDLKTAQDAVNSATQFFGDQSLDLIDRLILKGEDWKTVLDDLTHTLIMAALQASLLGEGPLSGLFGTKATTAGGTGGLAGLIGSLFGGTRASGGPMSAGRVYRVHKDETIFTGADGTVVPARAGNDNTPVNITIVNSGQPVEQDGPPRRNSQGDLEVAVKNITNRNIARGDHDGAMGARYGASPQGLRR